MAPSPPPFEEHSTRSDRLNLRITPEDKKALADMADRDGISMNDLVIRALRLYHDQSARPSVPPPAPPLPARGRAQSGGVDKSASGSAGSKGRPSGPTTKVR